MIFDFASSFAQFSIEQKIQDPIVRATNHCDRQPISNIFLQSYVSIS
jgi:hypothetical protein